MGFFLNVVFESPLINIENALFRRNKSSLEQEPQHNKLPRLSVSTFDSDLTASSQNNKSLPSSVEIGSQEGEISLEEKAKALQDNQSEAEMSSSGCGTANSSPEQERKQQQGQLIVSNIQPFERPALKSGSLRLNYRWSSDARSKNYQQQIPLSKLQRPDPYLSIGSEQGNREQDAGSTFLNGHPQMGLIQQQQRRKRPQMRMMQTNNNGDIYNVNGEYCHYAPGQYQKWRLENGIKYSAGPQTVRNNPTLRPRQYATLARTDRLSTGSRSQSLRRDFYESPVSLNSSGLFVSGPMHNEHQRIPFDSSFRHGPMVQENTDEEGNRNRGILDSSTLSRHQTRYNTLTGSNARDWSPQYASKASLFPRIKPMGVRQVFDADEDPYRSNWPKQYRDNMVLDENRSQNSDEPSRMSMRTPDRTLEGELPGEIGGLSSMVSSTSGVDVMSTQWLKPGAMIPRIDSSTLRRQVRRGDTAMEDSIVEEPQEDESSAL